MKKLLFALSVAAMVMFSGCSTKVGYASSMGWDFMTADLDEHAPKAYAEMMERIKEKGDPAYAMMKEWEVKLPKDELSNDDIKETIYALAEEYNMRVTNYVKMYDLRSDLEKGYIKEIPKGAVVEARIWSLCNLTTAKVFLNYSRWYGGFMPCRIMLVEYDDGRRYLISMDMTLAIYGGKTLPKGMLEAALKVKKAMEEIPARAAEGDF